MAHLSSSIGVAPPSRFIAFFDECGDHSLTKIDPDFPLFVLAMVVVQREAYQDEILPKMNAFKLRYWNHEGINLHSRDIRLAQGPFSILLNAQVRTQFMSEISELMETLPFTLTCDGDSEVSACGSPRCGSHQPIRSRAGVHLG